RLGISSAQWGLFGQVWPVGTLLAEAMDTAEVEGKRILELGCGIGLPSLGDFDKIIGSDLLYERGHPALLAGVTERHARPQSEAVLTDAGRRHTSAFSREMAALGFGLEESHHPLQDPDGTTIRARLLRYRRGLPPKAGWSRAARLRRSRRSRCCPRTRARRPRRGRSPPRPAGSAGTRPPGPRRSAPGAGGSAAAGRGR